MENEALNSSKIEGEVLNRESLQSSIKRNFGLMESGNKNFPAEFGIAEMMVDLDKNFNVPLSDQMLCNWHDMLMNGRRDLQNIGSYRTHEEAMQIVSGSIGKSKVHFEAPPSRIMQKEMAQFVKWFNSTSPKGAKTLPALTRTAIAHIYFVCIHPFEDGNGRISRAISENALLQSLESPVLMTLSQTIQRNKKDYYNNLEISNKGCDLTTWITYFAKTILEAQDDTIQLLDFIINKTKFYDKYKNKLNARQDKVIARLLKENISGFVGGLSANNYMSITKTTASTATRDLQDLVQKNILKKAGSKKTTRYYLNFII